MAEDAKKIKLLFIKKHDHVDASGVVKSYKAGDSDMFTQKEADAIRARGTAQTVANPGPGAPAVAEAGK